MSSDPVMHLEARVLVGVEFAGSLIQKACADGEGLPLCGEQVGIPFADAMRGDETIERHAFPMARGLGSSPQKRLIRPRNNT